MSSYAYQPIHDPSDPAWDGYADMPPAPWRRVRRSMMAAGALVAVSLVVAALAAASGGDGAADEPRAATSAEATPAPATPNTAAATVDSAEPELVPAAGSPAGRDAGTVPVMSEDPPQGWAPLDDTYVHPALDGIPDSSSFGLSPFASSRLTGDLVGLDPTLAARLDQMARFLGRTLDVVSGMRTQEEQAVLYDQFLAGTGNLAAVPGTSRHERGQAADVYVDGVALADVQGASLAATSIGIGFPVAGEPWHIEVVTSDDH